MAYFVQAKVFARASEPESGFTPSLVPNLIENHNQGWNEQTTTTCFKGTLRNGKGCFNAWLMKGMPNLFALKNKMEMAIANE